MDEKMNEKLKEIYDSLTDEQKEKAMNCKTVEELMDFAGEEDIELPEELVESVAGGKGNSPREWGRTVHEAVTSFCK